MLFVRMVLVVIAAASGFFVGGYLTQVLSGAWMGAIIGFLVMLLITRRMTAKPRGVGGRSSAAQISAAPVEEARLADVGRGAPRKRSKVGRIVLTLLSLVGVSGVIAILTYIEDQKDRERDRRQWAEEQYRQNEQGLLNRVSSSASGRVFDSQTQAPLANAAIGYMSNQGFVTLARTAPDGSFRIDMGFVPQDNYPIRLAVVGPNARGRVHYTNVYLQYAQQLQNLNLFVMNQ